MKLTREQMEEITIRKARCPVCRKLIVVTTDGTLGRHNAGVGSLRGTIIKCEGGGLPADPGEEN